MVLLEGTYKGSKKSAELNMLYFSGYLADTDGNKIDKISFGSKVRFYAEKWWVYNVELRIFLKPDNGEEVEIKSDSIQNLITLYFSKQERYFEIQLGKRSEYKGVKDAKSIELCCGVSNGFGWFYPQEHVAKIKIMPPYVDPLANIQIRYNRASNLFGQVRNNSTTNHQGFDYYAIEGTDIIAISNGIVDRIVDSTDGDYGKQLIINIDDSIYYAFYAHLSSIDVQVGDVVKQGAVIGKTGTTGNASSMTGDDQHLHFECRTASILGKGLNGRENPNNIVLTKFYSQDESQTNQTTLGVKKVHDGNETLMNIIE